VTGAAGTEISGTLDSGTAFASPASAGVVAVLRHDMVRSLPGCSGAAGGDASPVSGTGPAGTKGSARRGGRRRRGRLVFLAGHGLCFRLAVLLIVLASLALF